MPSLASVISTKLSDNTNNNTNNSIANMKRIAIQNNNTNNNNKSNNNSDDNIANDNKSMKFPTKKIGQAGTRINYKINEEVVGPPPQKVLHNKLNLTIIKSI